MTQVLDLTTDELLLLQRATIKRYRKQEQLMKTGNKKGSKSSGAAFNKKTKSLEDSLGKFKGLGQFVDE